MATHGAPFCRGSWVGAGSAWRRHAPTPRTWANRPGGRQRSWPSPPLLGSLASRTQGWGRRGVGVFRAGGMGWPAGMGQADLAARGQGSAGLAGLLSQQSTTLGRLEESLVDLAVVEGAGGDQVVEVAGRLPQLAVALADRGGGDPGQLLGERRQGGAVTRAVADGRKLHRASWPLRRSAIQPLQ